MAAASSKCWKDAARAFAAAFIEARAQPLKGNPSDDRHKNLYWHDLHVSAAPPPTPSASVLLQLTCTHVCASDDSKPS